MTDNYEPICLIGKGNFGSISKIRRKSDGKILVWKELNYGTMKEKYKHHISSEINILKELHHPNIVKYYDRIIDKENTKIFIIMEYCPGGDISQLIKRCRHQKQYISEEIIWKIFSQVASALYACHTNKSGKILHRDIKPSNVFLDNDNNVKLGDFGLSLMLNKDMNFAYSNVGTPYYMSPEQVDENKYNEKSDIWSLGCFLYELTSLHPPFEAHNHLSLALKIKSGKIEKLPEKYSENLCKLIFWMMNVEPDKRPTIKDIILLPEVNIRIKERKIKEGYQRLKKYENELKIKEENLMENEKKLKMKEKYLDEREKNLIQRENYIKIKEEEINKNKDGTDKNYNKYKENNSLFITSGGFDIKGLNNLSEIYNQSNNNPFRYDSELNTIKNAPIINSKKYFNRTNAASMNELKPININKKYANTIRRSMNEEKSQYDYDINSIGDNDNQISNNNKENSSFYGNKIKANIDMNDINNNNNNSSSLKNLLTNNYNTAKNNINSINFNNSNNSLTKINSNKNIMENHSKIISFNSELNYSSNDEKIMKNNNNNINTSNINSLGFLSINSQDNNTMLHNNSNNNMNGSMKNNNSIYHNRHSSGGKNNYYSEFNKNSYGENNMDYKSGSTNYFSSIPRTSGESYNDNINNNEGDINNIDNNMNINYNSYNIRNSQNNDSKHSLNINNYKDNNYRIMKKENMSGSKKSKQVLNIEYNKKYASEQNNEEYNGKETKRNNRNNLNKYIPNNFRNNSYGKKTKINDEQNNSENSLNIKYIRHHQNTNNIPRKKYNSSNSSNSINIINFNNINNSKRGENSKLSPESCRFEENYKYKNDNISRNRQGRMEEKYYKNEYNVYEDNNNNNNYKHKNKMKNINYNSNINGSNKEIQTTKNKNYNGENVNDDMKRRKYDSNTNRYINTINNKENNYYRF